MGISSVSQTEILLRNQSDTLDTNVAAKTDSIEVFSANNVGNNVDEFTCNNKKSDKEKNSSKKTLKTLGIVFGLAALGIATTVFLKKNNINLIKNFKTTPVFEPKVIPQEKKARSLLSLYNDKLFHILNYGDGYFSKNCNPVTMTQKALPKQKIMYVSNFHYPGGSIAASSKLSECLVTDKMNQCASVAIVDLKKKIQTLAHCFPKQTQDEITELLRRPIIDGNPNDLRITIVQGCSDVSESTIVGIKKAIESLAPKVKIKYADFPRHIRYSDRAVMLHNGELCACTSQEIEEVLKIINPKKYISYVLMEGYNDNRLKYFLSKNLKKLKRILRTSY